MTTLPTADHDRPKTIRLADYHPPDYWIDTIHLHVSLDPERTIVKTRLDVRRSLSAPRGKDGAPAPLTLDGEALALLSIAMDGEPMAQDAYRVGEKTLTIHSPPEAFILETEVAISPVANTALSGLYVSNGMFCTQCEAEGFRRITYYPDRPDVLASFTVRLEADKSAYPVLLANGNNIAAGDLENGRHFAEWEDPHQKPAYLFALVGGDLAAVEDKFTTRSGREVTLKVFVQHQNKDKCAYTLDALKRSMRWDEERFGREYDLDIFMIVAVDHFNFGAMENKGLNIFNSAYVLASPETATDADYEAIESIVGHEYFHNWSGNRVTLRDWFQLCLKEGFTVFRDQEFSADMRSRPVQRIKDVRRLWSSQFPEDAGPLAHAPRPSEYITIDNFYTATVYEKGAELSRMLMTILGQETFRKATDLYFDRHDGQAATVEDFVSAMEEASGQDLTQFRLWYTEAGAPNVTAAVTATTKIEDPVELTLRQQTKTINDDEEKAPRAMPVAYALVGKDSGEVVEEGVLDFHQAERTFTFGPYSEPVVPSLFRSFSAPVVLDQDLTLDDRLTILTAETDLFNRWNAGDQIWRDLCVAFAAEKNCDTSKRDATMARFTQALAEIIARADEDHALTAEILTAPAAADLLQMTAPVNPVALAQGRANVRAEISHVLEEDLRALYQRLASDAPYSPAAPEAGRRALRNAALSLLVAGGVFDEAAAQAAHAANMTDEAAAVSALAQSNASSRDQVLNAFYDRWRQDPLVVNKWLAFNAMRTGDNALEAIAGLTDHDAFDHKTPNKVRSLVGAFAYRNMEAFHRSDGAGYDFLIEQIMIVDPLNPQLASRLTTAFDAWRRLDPARRVLAETALKKLLDGKPSSNLYEMATRLLGVS